MEGQTEVRMEVGTYRIVIQLGCMDQTAYCDHHDYLPGHATMFLLILG